MTKKKNPKKSGSAASPKAATTARTTSKSAGNTRGSGGKGRGPSMRTSVADAKDALPSLIHDAEQGSPVEITRRGEPVAVLVGYQAWQRLVGEGPTFWDALCSFRTRVGLDDPQNPLHLDDALTSLRDPGTGRSFSFDDDTDAQ